MGKVSIAAATEMKRKKKKGRPSKNPLPLSTPPKPPTPNSTGRRSTRRNPNHFNSELDDGDDDDDERKEKKVKLVVRLPQSDERSKVDEKRGESRRHSRDSDSDSGSGSGSGSESDRDSEGCAKKRRINGADQGSEDGVSDQDKEIVKGANTSLHGSPLESGPTTPLPDKKLLIFILDRLQKKDTYGVFSEPVDPTELPDYFDIIEQPMDFGTVRKKLDNGAYKNLEELEADVLLICSNAMQYNSADTVYYRQARTIQDIAKRDFNNLKHEGDDGEPQPRVIRRGRPPSSKNQKKPLEASPVDRVGNEFSSCATLAKEEDKAAGSNSYNLRKGPTQSRFRSTDPFVSSYGSRNGENYSEWLVDWNNEFPASILRADMKHGKKQFTVDENRRDTYKQFHSLSSGNNPLVLSNSIGNMKRLVPVGLQEALAYARSLARYAANLGPVAWKMASKKIEAVLPAGVQYGPGWVGDKEVLSQTSSFSIDNQRSSNSNSSKLPTLTPLPSDLTSAVRKPDAQFPSHQNFNRNGFSGINVANTQGAGKVKMEPGIDLSSNKSLSMNHVVPDQANNSVPPGYQMREASDLHAEGEEKWNLVNQALLQQRHSNNNNLSGAPDLNVRVPAGSPNSSLQIGSPQQPDLALQL